MSLCSPILAEIAKKEEERWYNLLSKYKSMERNGEYCTLLPKVNSFLEHCEHHSAKKGAMLYKINLLWNLWKDHCKFGTSHWQEGIFFDHINIKHRLFVMCKSSLFLWPTYRWISTIITNLLTFCYADTERSDLSLVVDLVSQVHYLLLKEDQNLTPDDKKSLAKYMARLGFRDDAKKIYPALTVRCHIIHLG